MPNPLTDSPAAVIPFDQMAPDLASMDPVDYATALASLDTLPTFKVGTFDFLGPLVNAVRQNLDPEQAIGLIPFTAPALGLFHFKLDVGVIPEGGGYDTQYVSLWVIDQDGNQLYRCNVGVGASYRDVVTVPDGTCCVVMRLCKQNRPTFTISNVTSSVQYGGRAEVTITAPIDSNVAFNGRALTNGDMVDLWGTDGRLYEGPFSVLLTTSTTTFVLDTPYVGTSKGGTVVLPYNFVTLAPVECALAAAFSEIDITSAQAETPQLLPVARAPWESPGGILIPGPGGSGFIWVPPSPAPTPNPPIRIPLVGPIIITIGPGGVSIDIQKFPPK